MAKKINRESQFQQSCVMWFRLQYPEYALNLISIPNGAHLDGDKRKRGIQMGILKKEGLTEGAHDLVLFLPTNDTGCLHIEMKAPGRFKRSSRSQSKLSAPQKRFRIAMEKVGYKCVVLDDFDDFRITVERHVMKHLTWAALNLTM